MLSNYGSTTKAPHVFGLNKTVLYIRTRDVSYLCMLYIKLGMPQDDRRETPSQRLTTNSVYVFCGFWKSGEKVIQSRSNSHFTEFPNCTVLIPRCLRYVNATLLFILTEPSTPAAIPNGLREGEISAIFQRRSVKQY